MSGRMITVHVRMLSGKTVDVEVEETGTVAMLRERFVATLDDPITATDPVEFVANGKRLTNDTDKLSDLGVRDKCTVLWIMAMRRDAPTPPRLDDNDDDDDDA